MIKIAIISREHYNVQFPDVFLPFAERPWVKVLTSNFPNIMKQMC